MKNIHREAELMKRLDYPNIVHLYEVMETQQMVYLVLEFAGGGEVLDYIVAHGRLKEPEAKRIFRQIVDALTYCHSMQVVHRDLKAENLLFDEELNVKITDFGLSNIFNTQTKLGTFCGSPVYSAPELIEGRKYVGPEVDCWSLGVNLFALTTGELPFASKDVNRLYDSISAAKYELPQYLTKECQDLIMKILVVSVR